MKRVVIVGGGQAAGQAAASLRQQGFDGEVVLVCDEPDPPYQRPPLSKQYLSGEHGRERLPLRPEQFYTDKDIKLELERRVESIDPGAHRVALAGGGALGYDKLILATGSRVRRLDRLPGADLDGICYLRTIADADRIREGLAGAKHVVIVGAGYIGLEVASVASGSGAEVTVLEAQPRILQRVATPQLSAFFERVHRGHGVGIRTSTALTGFVGSGSVQAVQLGEERLPADLVVVGVGITPSTELAAAAGLACDDGIAVDGSCRTSAPDILAAGDCTSHPSPYLGRRVRLESVPNAMEQGRIAASTACGEPKSYEAEPWFWSDQYDLKLQMAGFTEEADAQITRGDPDRDQFITFHLKNGVVVGVDSVNNLREFLGCRKLVSERRAPDPQRLADPSVPVKELLADG